MFSNAGAQNWRDNLSGRSGKAEWHDPNSGGDYVLTVEENDQMFDWNLSSNGFLERGLSSEADAVRKAYERIRIQLFDSRGGSEPPSNVTRRNNDDAGARDMTLTLMGKQLNEVAQELKKQGAKILLNKPNGVLRWSTAGDRIFALHASSNSNWLLSSDGLDVVFSNSKEISKDFWKEYNKFRKKVDNHYF